MKIIWMSGPRETEYGELQPEGEYDIPDGSAVAFISLGLARRADKKTYPAKTEAIRKAPHETAAPEKEGR